MEETATLFDGEQQGNDLAHMGGEAATSHLSRANILQDPTHSTKEEENCEPATDQPSKHRPSSEMTTASAMNWLKREEVE